MSNAGQALFAKYKLLQYLLIGNKPKKAKNILQHLQHHTEWGNAELAKEDHDGGLRAVQNWLKTIRDTSEFNQLIRYEEINDNPKNLTYESQPQALLKTDMSIDEACFRLMSHKFLLDLLPAEFYEESLKESFSEASSRLEKYERNLNPRKLAVRSFLNRIAIAPRGQRLVNQNVPRGVLNVIYSAMLDNRCVKMRYNRKSWLLHPYAIVIREPKYYLLGVDHKVRQKRAPENDDIRQFLCNHIEGAEVSERTAQVPEDFNATEHVNRGRMDVTLRKNMGLSERSFTLELQFYNVTDNLRRDLEAFPISRQQVIIDEPDTDNFTLTASGMRASHQLVEWILGRQAQVEVLKPEKLRNYVAKKIDAMQRLYT
jgi:hypothetical protein